MGDVEEKIFYPIFIFSRFHAYMDTIFFRKKWTLFSALALHITNLLLQFEPYTALRKVSKS